MTEPVTDLDHARYDRDGWMETALGAQRRVAQLEAENTCLRSALTLAAGRLDRAADRIDAIGTALGVRQWADEARNAIGVTAE